MTTTIIPGLPFEKLPTEAFPIGFQFYGELPPNASIVSSEVYAKNLTDDLDDNSVLESTEGVQDAEDELLYLAAVRAGTVGKTYRVYCKANLSTGADHNVVAYRDMTIIEA